jgi:hypothetical protein
MQEQQEMGRPKIDVDPMATDQFERDNIKTRWRQDARATGDGATQDRHQRDGYRLIQ